MSSTSGSNAHVVFHYPPEVLQNLKEAIPLLCRSKKDVISFFHGAGAPESVLADLRRQIQINRDGISKYEIVRTVLERLNARKAEHLRELREVVRRVIEIEDFSMCWPNDQLKAQGLVAVLRSMVQVKDAFTRMNIEREQEAKKARTEAELKAKFAQQRRENIQAVAKDLFALFGQTDPFKRGKSLEGVLNRLFEAYGMSVREAFVLKGSCGEGIVEQIDGVVEVDSDLCARRNEVVEHANRP